jgi:hypothetical protein
VDHVDEMALQDATYCAGAFDRHMAREEHLSSRVEPFRYDGGGAEDALAAIVADGKAGRWTLLFAQPISHVRLASIETMVTVGGVVALYCSAAVAV